MRHLLKKNNIKPGYSHNKMVLVNMTLSLLKVGYIYTTLSRAKVLRSFVEPLITRSKKKTLHNIRIISSRINSNKMIIGKLFDILGPFYLNRMGGYTRITRVSALRKGDSSSIALISLVDYDKISVE